MIYLLLFLNLLLMSIALIVGTYSTVHFIGDDELSTQMSGCAIILLCVLVFLMLGFSIGNIITIIGETI